MLDLKASNYLLARYVTAIIARMASPSQESIRVVVLFIKVGRTFIQDATIFQSSKNR